VLAAVIAPAGKGHLLVSVFVMGTVSGHVRHKSNRCFFQLT